MLDSFDIFAKPVINFNMRGKERVTSRCGLAFSFMLVMLVIYFILNRIVQIFGYQSAITRENLGESQAIRKSERINIAD